MSIPSFALSAVTSLVAESVSSNVLLPTVGSPTTVLVVNLGVSVVYLLLGSSSVVVSPATGVALLPGTSIALSIGSATNLAAISDQSVPLNIAVELIMGFLYYGEPISKNILRNPNDDTIVCRNAVIARTGFQTYRGIDVADELKKIGVDADPYDVVEVYRSPEEVFSKATIASFEGKPVTDGHPDDLLNANTIKAHQCGHVQNVRRGTDALPSGDWPLLADLFITDADLIEKIESGLRELSCGYNYELVKDGNRIVQVDIVGNHVAVVPTGRAGKHAAIKDSGLSTIGEIKAVQRIEAARREVEQKRLLAALTRRLAHSGRRAVVRDAEPERTPEEHYKAARERLLKRL